MKRFIATILTLALMCSFAPAAFAATDEATRAAQALYDLGLFQGTGNNADGTPNFDLDRTPTRHEAVTMLVRLLGKDAEAKAGSWTTPFTDVADWAKPYVGYAYANGLTTGTSATTFGGEQTIDATQYLTFVLRALGYTSGTDFQWDSAWTKSDEIGLTAGQYNASTTSFTRGDMAVISNNALSVKKEKGIPDTSTQGDIDYIKIGDKLYRVSVVNSAGKEYGYWDFYVYNAQGGIPCTTVGVFGVLIDLLSGNYTISDETSSNFLDGTLVYTTERRGMEIKSKKTEVALGSYVTDTTITYNGVTMEYSFPSDGSAAAAADVKKSTGLSCKIEDDFNGPQIIFWVDDLASFFEITDSDLVSRLCNLRYETIGSRQVLVLE